MSITSSNGIIYLRHDQNEKCIGRFEDVNVGVYAPLRVKNGLEVLGKELHNVTFKIYDHRRLEKSIDTLTLVQDKFGLKELQKVARNEEHNVTGQYKTSMYEPLGNKFDVIVALKDLVRQCVVVGSEKATHFGGYPCHNSRKKQYATRVVICDLAALQFQKYQNTGRFVLSQKQEKIKGILDEYIFENVVGEPKRKYEDIVEYVKNDTEGRYITTNCFGNDCFFDVFAYRRFIAGDLILCGLASVHVASREGYKLNFKFLKYGSGFFAGNVSKVINKYVLSGVVMALVELFEKHGGIVKGFLSHVEFPFYEKDEESIKQLENLREKHGLEYTFSMDDALKETKKGLVTMTTNCGDPSVVFGNEMDFASVDAAIAENVKSKGNTFSSILNKGMKEYFVNTLDGSIINCEDCKDRKSGLRSV